MRLVFWGIIMMIIKIYDVNLMPNWEIVKFYKKINLKRN